MLVNLKECIHFAAHYYRHIIREHFGDRTKSFENNNCLPNNNYQIDFMLAAPFSQESKWLSGTPSLFLSLRRAVFDRCKTYNTNIEGITSDDVGQFYAVSDNLFANGLCDLPGQNMTLLIKIKKM